MLNITLEEFLNESKYRRGGFVNVDHEDFEFLVMEFSQRYASKKRMMLIRIERMLEKDPLKKSLIKFINSLRETFPQAAITINSFWFNIELTDELWVLGFMRDEYSSGQTDLLFVPN